MIRRSRLPLGCVALGGALLLAGAAVAKPSALSLMRRSEKWHEIPAERVVGAMILQKKGGAQKVRKLMMTTVQNDKTGDRSLIRFLAPANIKGTAMLSVEDKKAGRDDQWLYLPAFRRTRRIGAAELGDRFVGSDFFYEDMKARDVDDYRYRHLREQTVDGARCYVIECVPKKPKVKKESPYGKSHIWLDKSTLMPVRLRHFDRRMRPLKEIRFTQRKRIVKKAWRADRATVIDVQRKHRTVLLLKKRTTKLRLPPGFFSSHRLGK